MFNKFFYNISGNKELRNQIEQGKTEKQIRESWKPEDQLVKMEAKVVLNLEGRDVVVQAWEYKIKGIKGFEVPIYFLDTNLEENGNQDESIV